MKSKQKIWAIALGIVTILAAGVFLWDQQNRKWFDSAAPTASALPPAPPQVTKGVVVAVGSFDFAEPNNRYPEFPEELAQFLEAKSDSKVTFVNRKPDGKSAPTSPDAWVMNGSYSALGGERWSVTFKLDRVRGGALALNAEGEKGRELNEKIAAGVIKAVTTPSTNLVTLAGKREEASLHIERGRALAQLADPSLLGMVNPDAAWFQDRDDAARRRFRLRQAMRSFESALALAPKDNQAKTFLAKCYLSSFIRQPKRGATC